MPPSRQSQHSTRSRDLHQLAKLHGGSIKYSRFQPQPYPPQTPIPSSRPLQPSFVLPPYLLNQINLAQGAATRESTLAKDASCLHEFLAFCEHLGIREAHALPAREDLLITWASSFAGRLAGKTVGAKISAIRKEHFRRNLTWHGGECLRLILKGVEGLRPPSSFYSKRSPVTITMLEDLNKNLSRSSGLDNCIQAICCLSFFCQLRIGEILPPTKNLKKFDPHRHATFAHIAESTATNGACNLHLPWSKTQKTRGDDHFIKNRLHTSHPISAYRDAHNKVVTLTRPQFICRINQILQATGKAYPHITGHCFRIGGTTFYLVLGVPPDMVKKFGHWRSHAFLEYWRCMDYLGKIHLDMLPLNPSIQLRSSRNLPKS
ncbi:hypothetical protein BYT27DRAFT_7265341 [Phlegmacium glaucopus]|nr:hypothetical protein BYT27DRAFT_7265341 [Phlegmacium glaucopus]